MYNGSLLSLAMCEIMWCRVMCSMPKPLQAWSTSSLSRYGREWSTPRRFHYSHIWKQVLGNISRHFSFTSLIVSFSCEALLQYLVYRVLTVIIFSRLINHNKQKKIFCMHPLHFLSYILDSCKQVHRTFNQGWHSLAWIWSDLLITKICKWAQFD